MMNCRRKVFFLGLLAILFMPALAAASARHVSLAGDDLGPGTQARPWRTIAHAAAVLQPGDTVLIHRGRYYETIDVTVSGTPGNFITFRNYGTDEVIIDGRRASASETVLLRISKCHHLRFSGLHFTAFQGRDRDGVRIDQGASQIEFIGNRISEIAFSADPAAKADEDDNARPLIVLGDDPAHSCRAVTISDNEIFSCRPGYSEALALNGNVEDFVVSCNRVHDITNIGIDCIGFEETVSDPDRDRARHGRCCGNLVYNCLSPYADAAGIYVDGGRDIVIENNIVHDCQWGIEVGCEHPGKRTEAIVVRDNFLYHNRAAGVALGGYDYPDASGTVSDCLIRNNTLMFNNARHDWQGEMAFSHASDCTVVNNIFYGDGEEPLLVMEIPAGSGNRFDYNLWYGTAVVGGFWAEIVGVEYNDLAAWRSATGWGLHSLAVAPGLPDVKNVPLDCSLLPGSPVIDAGDPQTLVAAGEMDCRRRQRRVGPAIDIGAAEYGNTTLCSQPLFKVGNCFYDTLTAAATAAAAGNGVVQWKSHILAGELSEDFQCSAGASEYLLLQGGCDCDFNPGHGFSTLAGTLTIVAGHLEVEALIITGR